MTLSCSSAAISGLGGGHPCVRQLRRQRIGTQPRGPGRGRPQPAKGEQHIFALGDCASLVPEGAGRPLPSTAQVANQQAMHLIRHLPNWLRTGKPVPPFRFRDFGALVALSDYNAFGTLGRFGFFKGGFIKGRFAQLSHAVLYRRHQLSLHGPSRAALLWLAERINALVQPTIRMS
jgi:NADH:ubiquinone reductase (H+-translocating)